MSRGNDAVPSWSGFNYQGKVSILCALQQINQNANFDDYCIELEKQEDFTILKDEKAIALYQVKALLSKEKQHYYTHSSAPGESIAEKLIQHKQECGNYFAKCYLVSAINIVDWDSEDNPYKKDISLYKYGNDIVSIEDCPKYVQSEISIFLASQNINTTDFDVKTIYGRLCLFLDKKIALMHSQGYRDREYRIPLSEFVEVIKNTIDMVFDQQEFRQKEYIYNYLVKTFHDLIPAYCENDCLEQPCNPNCVVNRLEEEFSQIGDIRKYIKVINPNITEWSNDLDYVSHASMDALREHIVRVFYHSRNAEAIKKQCDGIAFESDLSSAKNKLVLPTLVTIGANAKHSLETALQNIKNNISIRPSIAGNSLLVKMDTKSTLSLRKNSINSSWTVWNDQAIDSPYAGTEIISEEKFLEELDNGTN